MAGHSKWSTIKHKKAANDKARGKLFAKVLRQVDAKAADEVSLVGRLDPLGHDLLAELVGHGADRLDDGEGEAPEAVVGDDADGHRARAVQALSEVVGAVADLAGDAHDGVARLLAQATTGVEGLAGGAEGYPGEAGHIADGGTGAAGPGAGSLLGIRGHRYLTAPLRKPET